MKKMVVVVIQWMSLKEVNQFPTNLVVNSVMGMAHILSLAPNRGNFSKKITKFHSFFYLHSNLVITEQLNRATLGLGNYRLALLSKVIYIIVLVGTTESSYIKWYELYCICNFTIYGVRSKFMMGVLLSGINCTNDKGDDDCDGNDGVLTPKCEPIDICIVCVGTKATRAVYTLVKSILFYRNNPLNLHLITDEISKEILGDLFDTWKLKQVKVRFYSASLAEKDVSWIPSKHYSGIYALFKLSIPKILPKSVGKVIVLDTDLVLAADISKLWRFFDTKFKSESKCFGLVENQSDWYIPGKRWPGHDPWPAVGNGFNTGVMLLHLDRLRELKWHHLWKVTAEKELISQLTTELADQDIINAVIKRSPDLVAVLPCRWNLQLALYSRDEFCGSKLRSPRDAKIIHFNSPLRHKVEVKDIPQLDYFKSHFLAFQQFDGNLLKTDFLDCGDEAGPKVKVTPDDESDLDKCHELNAARNTTYITHPYFIPYRYDPPPEDVSRDVTLVAQLSMDRLHMVESLHKQWSGPISLAVYLSDSEVEQFLTFVRSSLTLKARFNVGYHVVYKRGNYYPVNYLRNVALSKVKTPFVFLSDIDFLPGEDVYSSLMKAVEGQTGGGGGDPDKVALVIPAFETHRYRLSRFPKSKADVVNLLDLGQLLQFRYHVWTKGHQATNYNKWQSSTKPFKVRWEPDFEPYIVVKKDSVPDYDRRFVGFGWNKVSHIMELSALGFEFWVLPNVFMIHMPHAPSLDIARFRASDQFRLCLEKLKKEFIDEINTKYDGTFSLISDNSKDSQFMQK